ncbi:patatin-like phospholipase family protein [Geodermatophilus sp. URMC 64]
MAAATHEAAVRIRRPEDVHFLALEGGGGKGVTYLGAVRALERLGVLPIDIDRPGQSQIRGISGASAGAITALLLSMGATAAALERILSNPSTFTRFFDGPDPGRYRVVDKDNRPGVRSDAPPGVDVRAFVAARAASVSGRLAAAEFLLPQLIRFGVLGPPTPILQRLARQPDAYLYNFLFDRGLFPGFQPRRFFQSQMNTFLGGKLLRMAGGDFGRVRPADALSFRAFRQLTGIDLVVTGANVTTHKPAMFSERLTPDFPVAEAVGISMNLPLLFKPVLVEAQVPAREGGVVDDYGGFWVDGGLLNNLPLHAFDHRGAEVAGSPGLYPLKPDVLGLRLTEGPARAAANLPGPEADVLKRHLAGVFETLMFPAEQGQLRTRAEADQTIDLFTYELETTEFAPPAAKQAEPIANAQRAVTDYFAGA